MKEQIVDAANADIHQQGFIGGFYIRPMRLEAGAKHDGHAHWIDHVSNVLTPLRIDWRNVETGEEGFVICKVPCKLLVKAKVWHTFSVLDGEPEARWECWFSEAEADKHYDMPVPYHLERGEPLPLDAGHG
jgi:hypothetical protein